MGEMIIDLSFADSHGLGEFPGVHRPFAQENDDLLPNRLPVIPLFFGLHAIDSDFEFVSRFEIRISYSQLFRKMQRSLVKRN